MAAKRWTPGQRERLGALLTERREELDPRYYVRDVFAAERGINLRMAADLEKGRPRNFTPVTLRDVVAPAYAVTYESITAAADGGDLEALPGTPAHKTRSPRPAATPEQGGSRGPEAPPGFISEEMEEAAQPYADEIWRKLLSLDPGRAPRLADADMPDPGGAKLFGEGTQDAEYWDLIGRRGRTVRERTWLLATLQSREAAARGRQAGTG